MRMSCFAASSDDGRDLVIPRTIWRTECADRASEVATELLGERTVEQAQEVQLEGG